MLHNRFEIINTYVLKTLGKEEFFMGHNHNEGANKGFIDLFYHDYRLYDYRSYRWIFNK